MFDQFPPHTRPDLQRFTIRPDKPALLFAERLAAKRLDYHRFERCWHQAADTFRRRTGLLLWRSIATDWRACWAADLFVGAVGGDRRPAAGLVADLHALVEAGQFAREHHLFAGERPVVWLFPDPAERARGLFYKYGDCPEFLRGLLDSGVRPSAPPVYSTAGFLGVDDPDFGPRPAVTAAALLGDPTAAELDSLARLGLAEGRREAHLTTTAARTWLRTQLRQVSHQLALRLSHPPADISDPLLADLQAEERVLRWFHTLPAEHLPAAYRLRLAGPHAEKLSPVDREVLAAICTEETYTTTGTVHDRLKKKRAPAVISRSLGKLRKLGYVDGPGGRDGYRATTKGLRVAGTAGDEQGAAR